MFKNLLLEEDSDDSFSGGQEDVDIQVSISDFDSSKINVQQVKRISAQAIQKLTTTLEEVREKFKFEYDYWVRAQWRYDVEQEGSFFMGESTKKVWEDIIEESRKKVEVITKQKDELIKEIEESKKLYQQQESMEENVVKKYLLLGALSSLMIPNKSKAKSIKNQQPLKCPTYNTAKRVAKQLKNTQKEYKAIKNKTKTDINKYKERIIHLNLIKENYKQCQRQGLYK